MKLRMNRLACGVLAAAAVVGSLSACAPILIGGAVMGGLVAVDRRTAGTQVEDEGIELRVISQVREAVGDKPHLNVTSYNRQVLLTGEVPTAAMREQIEQVAGRSQSVLKVVNDLGVMANTSLTQRSSDTLTTTRVRASLVDAKDISASSFKVVTERNVVYLMGRVTPREADRATEIARGVGSVAKVVRVFELMTEEELRNLSAARQDPPSSSTGSGSGGMQ